MAVSEKPLSPIDTNSKDFPAILENLVGIFACGTCSFLWLEHCHTVTSALVTQTSRRREEWREAEMQLLSTLQSTKEHLHLSSEAISR